MSVICLCKNVLLDKQCTPQTILRDTEMGIVYSLRVHTWLDKYKFKAAMNINESVKYLCMHE